MAAAAGQLPDPVLKFGVENLPVNGPDRLSLSRDFMTMRRIGLSQELPSAQKRQLRSERVRARSRPHLRAETAADHVANISATPPSHGSSATTPSRCAISCCGKSEETETSGADRAVGLRHRALSQADVLAARAPLMLEDRLSQIDRQGKNAELMLARWVGPAAKRPSLQPSLRRGRPAASKAWWKNTSTASTPT
jgi:hypothetical protein